MPEVLGEICTLQGGFAFKSKDFCEDGVPVVKIANVTGGTSMSYSDMQCVPKVIAGTAERFRTEENDTLISMTGANVGKVTRVWPGDPNALINQRVGRFVPKAPEKYTKDFIHYVVCSHDAYEYFRNAAYGSAQPNISGRLIESLPLPELGGNSPIEVGALLRALDDKIELNRKTAATLEDMARALYRSWFVDFDPVHARVAGCAPAHMEAQTAALFPDSFGEDGLPEGWVWKQFEELFTVLETGRRPKGGVSEIAEGVPSIGAESIKGVAVFDLGKTKYVPREYFDRMNKGKLADGDVLVYKDGGKPGELRPAVSYVSKGFPFSEACINEHVFRVRVTEEVGQCLTYFALSEDHCKWQMRELATGVAQPGLNQTAMKSLATILPPNADLIAAFTKFALPLLDGCNEKAAESQTLVTLRDTLLPRLMSGELRVGEAKKQIEAVA